MKKINLIRVLVFIGILILTSCQKECWLCEVERRKNTSGPDYWYEDGLEKFCDKHPEDTNLVRYDCVLL